MFIMQVETLQNEFKQLYREILDSLVKLIPEKWNSVHLYASINFPNKGEMFFYYYPKGILKRNAVNCYEIVQKYGINEEQYNQSLSYFYRKIQKLYAISGKKWSNITINIDENFFILEYHFNNLNDNRYTPEQRHLIWCYKNLKMDEAYLTNEERNMIENYQEIAIMRPIIVKEQIIFYDGQIRIK